MNTLIQCCLWPFSLFLEWQWNAKSSSNSLVNSLDYCSLLRYYYLKLFVTWYQPRVLFLEVMEKKIPQSPLENMVYYFDFHASKCHGFTLRSPNRLQKNPRRGHSWDITLSLVALRGAELSVPSICYMQQLPPASQATSLIPENPARTHLPILPLLWSSLMVTASPKGTLWESRGMFQVLGPPYTVLSLLARTHCQLLSGTFVHFSLNCLKALS